MGLKEWFNILSCLLNGQRINCFDGIYNKDQLKKWSKKKILLCPVCGKPYEYCHGRVIPPYFRHMDKSECEDKYSEPETAEHIQGKRELYEWIKKQPGVTDVILEGWLPETHQRPDIMFKYNGKQCVIEYQCSPISTEYYERHELYQAAGINDIWILGTDKYFGENKRFNTLEKESGIYYNVATKHMIISKCTLDNIPDFIIELYSKEYSFSYLDEIKENIENKYFCNKGIKFYFYFMNEIEFKDKIIFNTELKNKYENVYNKNKKEMLDNILDIINELKNDDLDINIKESETRQNEYNVILINKKSDIKVIDKFNIGISVIEKIYYLDFGYTFDNFKEKFMLHANYYMKNLDDNIEKIKNQMIYTNLAHKLEEYIRSLKDNYCNYVNTEIRNNTDYYKSAVIVNFGSFDYGIFIKSTGVDFAYLNNKIKFSRWVNIESKIDINDIILLKDKIKFHLDNSIANLTTKYVNLYFSQYNNKNWEFEANYRKFITDNYCMTIKRKYNNVVIIEKDVDIDKNLGFISVEKILKDKIKEITKEMIDKKDGYRINKEYVRFLGVDTNG